MNLSKFKKENTHYSYDVTRYSKTIYPEHRPGGVEIYLAVEEAEPCRAHARIRYPIGDYMTSLTPDESFHGVLSKKQAIEWIETVLISIHVTLDELE